ncbi:hypothetical protein WSS_A34537 [Rhodococcus opacus M213]|uniref:Uncharacterized protein n=1 Tax=Rhodococcus opacus M213 TaxID=1129896 RepID=K8XLY1_RHOOP|nr:hypothetical protein WSS_A34537 [Rhodococcus opacus M213]
MNREHGRCISVDIGSDPHPPALLLRLTADSIATKTSAALGGIMSSELIENLDDRGRRDTEVLASRSTEAVAYVGEHGEFTLEVCCGSVAHVLILPRAGDDQNCTT